MRKHEAGTIESLAGELLKALLGRRPAHVLQIAEACLAERALAGGAEEEERREVLAAVALSASERYATGGSGVLPAELSLLTHFLM